MSTVFIPPWSMGNGVPAPWNGKVQIFIGNRLRAGVGQSLPDNPSWKWTLFHPSSPAHSDVELLQIRVRSEMAE